MVQRGKRPLDRKRGACRALGVVLVRGFHAHA
jgi:hypothetical protein